MPDNLASIWPQGSGEMAERVRAFDWSQTPLGPTEAWPPSLKVATRLALNSRHPMFIWWGPDHIQIYNDAYRETMGPEKHPDALGRTGRETWAEIWDTIGPQISQVMAGGPATWHEDQLVPVTRHGRREDVWWTYSFSPINDEMEPNGVGGVMVICRDMTTEHSAREAAAENEARLRTVLDGISEPFYALDSDWRFLFASQSALRLWGKDAGEVLGRPFLEAFPQAAGSAAFEAHRRVMETRVAERLETISPVVHRWIEIDFAPTPQGGLSVAFRDIEERRRAEDALRESEEKYRTVFESIDEGFLIHEMIRDKSGQVVDYRLLEANPAHQRATGLPRDTIGKLGSEFMPNVEPYWLELFHRVSTSGVAERAEMYNAPTSRWYNVQASPVRGHDRIAIVFDDVTSRKRAEAILRESEERQAFLLKLSDALRPLDDAEDIRLTAAQVLGRHLGANRVAYAENGGDHFMVARNYVDDTQEIVGRQNYVDFGPDILAELQAGQNRVQPDIRNDGRLSDHQKQGLAAADVGASLNVPLVKNGQLVAFLGVNYPVAHDFQPSEIALVEDVAERTWAAVERARAENALHQSERRLAAELSGTQLLQRLSTRLIPEQSPDVLHEQILDAAQELMEADAVSIQLLEDSGQRLRRLATRNLHPDSTEYWTWVDASHASTCGQALRMNTRMVVEDVETSAELAGTDDLEAFRRSGTRAAQSTPLVSRSGRPIGMISTHWHKPCALAERDFGLFDILARQVADLLERSQAEAALRASEERLRGFGEASTDVLWIRDAETLNWTYLTPAFEAIYGMPRDEALSGNNFRNWVELILPEDRDQAVDTIRRVRLGEPVTFEYRIRRPSDGQIRWLRNTDFPIRNAEGRVTAIGGVGHDASHKKEADRIIRASRRQMRTLIEGVPQLVWRGVEGGEWTWSSPQWTSFTGLSEAASTGRGWLAAVHPDDRERAMDAWQQAEATEEPLEVEYRIRQAGGEGYRWFQTRALPVRDEDTGRILEWLGTSTDVDDMRAMQESQAVMVAELQHRTRNLIAVVGSIARQTMAQTGPTTTFQAEFKDRLEALSRVQGLLSQAGEDRITIGEVVAMELKALGALSFGERVRVEGPDVPLRKSIVQTMALAIHELATNARKYGALSNGSGELAVRWTTSPAEENDRHLFFEWIERGVAVKFADGAAVTQGGGYGRRLIEESLPYSLKAKTTYELGPDGLACMIDLPLTKPRRSRA
ncbi:PAS domain S-box protein [Aureimonas leprariae]|uniref:Blue-light-activated histidine kinase n=1 Tax=Plantimonas leprariae TaxID=2615207 RepID=A0A7V7PKC0_9HYPH|nr:PAS domain S-box protein [Aureimonas leprariae]KAB0676202.1 PAS domain S-box protein [Aureimonas leprariae]